MIGAWPVTTSAPVLPGNRPRGAHDPTQTPHRYPDLPRDPGAELLLRRQDRLHPAVAGRGQALLPLPPRRFGKSLFLDTCKELFEANEPLFEGLAIHDRWDWSVRYPVVRLSFGIGNFKEPGYVEASLMEQLAAAERRATVVTEYSTASGRLASLLEALHERMGLPVAVLIDEYDKPILDALDVPETARANSDLPGRQEHVREAAR